jgi:hypothetical protein
MHRRKLTKQKTQRDGTTSDQKKEKGDERKSVIR